MHKPQDHFDALLRNHQLDFSTLDRERLEHLCQAFVEGQLVILDALMTETRQSAVIATQHTMIDQLTNALQTANMTLGADTPENANGVLSDHLISVAYHVHEWWPQNEAEAIQGLLLGVYRCLQTLSTHIEPEVLEWWKQHVATIGKEQPPEPAGADEDNVETEAV